MKLSKLETSIYGLKYLPSFSQDLDVLDVLESEIPSSMLTTGGNGQFSVRNGRLLRRLLRTRQSIKCIVEIGIARKYEESSTHILCSCKNQDTDYIGFDLDLAGKMDYAALYPNCVYFAENSSNIQGVLEKIKDKGHECIDILLIDGDHSIKMMANDWKYAEYVRSGGLVLIHDSNYHPGPKYVFDAIDERLFKKKKYFLNRNDDWGFAVCVKR